LTSRSALTIAAAPPLESLVKDYKGGSVAAAGEVFDPSPENLDARTQTVDLSGIRPALAEEEPRGDGGAGAHAALRQRGVAKGQTTAAGMLPALMMAGTKKHDRQAAPEQLDALGIRIFPGGGGGVRGRR